MTSTLSSSTVRFDDASAPDDDRRFTHALLALSGRASTNLSAFKHAVTAQVSRVLEVDRVSVWRYVGDAIECRALCAHGEAAGVDGARLTAEAHPSYFGALRAGELIVADDAAAHPATACFVDGYLRPLGIVSMLDVPAVSIEGLRGVLCVESLRPRAWSVAEVRFCADVASLLVQSFDLEARRAEAERLARVLATTSAMIYAARLPDFSLEYVSDSVTELLGYTADELKAPDFWIDAVHPDDRPRVMAELATLFSEGHHVHEYRHRHKAGGYRWLRDELRLERDASGTPVRAVGASFDITARRAQEARLDGLLAMQKVVARVSRALLGHRGARIDGVLREALADLGREMRADCACVLWLREGVLPEVHRWTPDGGEEACDDGVSDRCATSRDLAAFRDALHEGGAVRVIDDEGLARLSVSMRIEGAPRGVIVLVRPRLGALQVDEVTELVQLIADAVAAGLKRAEDEAALRRSHDDLERHVAERTRALRASEARFARLFQEAPQAMIMVDAERRVVQSNRRARALFGYESGDLDGLPLAELLPVELRARHEGLMRESFEGRAAGPMGRVRSVAAQRRDGARFDAEVGLVPMEFEGATQVLAGVSDVSERNAAQAALTASLREKETLLKEIHHRVKNNLQIISSLLMLQSDQMPTPESRALLHESVYRVRSMALIHQQLYGVVSLERIDLGDYVRTLAGSLRSTLSPASRLEFDLGPAAVTVEIAVPFGLIVNELLTNAFKYGVRRVEGAPDECRVRVALRAEPEGIRVVVHDCGPGLPESFGRAAPTTLGHQLVRSLTRQLRARMTTSYDDGARIELIAPWERT